MTISTNKPMSASPSQATPQSLAERRHAATIAERERRRWARELHDETLQGLGALRTLLVAAQAHGDDAQLRATMRCASDLLNDEIARLRRLIVDLRPSELDALGLGAAIEHLLGRWRREAEFALTWQLCELDAPRLAPDVETAIFRVVQEALTNIGKHARATEVHVVACATGGAIEVVVSDDGHGFEPGAPPGEHFGLLGMRERAQLVSGTLEIESCPAGTRLRLLVPAVYAAPASLAA